LNNKVKANLHLLSKWTLKKKEPKQKKIKRIKKQLVIHMDVKEKRGKTKENKKNYKKKPKTISYPYEHPVKKRQKQKKTKRIIKKGLTLIL
jgi:hypothetical protein